MSAPPSNNWLGGSGGSIVTPSYSAEALALPDGTTTGNPNIVDTICWLTKNGTGNVSGTLPGAGSSDGFQKIIVASVWTGGRYDLTVTGFVPPTGVGSGTKLRFTSAGQSATLVWSLAAGGWTLTNGGAEVLL